MDIEQRQAEHIEYFVKQAAAVRGSTLATMRELEDFLINECMDKEKKKHPGICQIEQPPERGIDDTAGAWVSTWSAQTSLLTEFFIWDRQSLLPLPSNCYNKEQREVYRVEQPLERGIHDTARAWVSTWSRQISVVDEVSRTAQPLTPPRSLGLPGAIRHCRREPVSLLSILLNVKTTEDFSLSLRTTQPPSENCCFQGIVKGKLDQLRRCFEVQFAAGRDLCPGQLASMIETLSDWWVGEYHAWGSIMLMISISHSLPSMLYTQNGFASFTSKINQKTFVM
nr:COP9 signalosome complex subunit 7 isoform X3 [Ipomoea batatas]